MEKEMKIVPPKGYEIDKENSTFECIKFKPIEKDLDYVDIMSNLLHPSDKMYYINSYGLIRQVEALDVSLTNIARSRYQLKKVLALNQLFSIARYYNGGWVPEWRDTSTNKYYIIYDDKSVSYSVIARTLYNPGVPVFKRREDAQAVINNPNFKMMLNTIFDRCR